METTLNASRRNDERAADSAPPRRVQPRADVWETEAAFFIALELPGVAQPDLTIELEKEVLTVEGISHTGRDAEGYERAHEEHASVVYRRSFKVPAEIRRDAIEADLSNGLLTLTLPKSDDSKPRTIPVRVS
ncbi:MAG TPA: Hsp20/alpha crystallin family protein [Planctomycetota bacterium]|nr:Hsp20/alpha crystallin family protein [Planctomycetota bacterium]